MSDRSSRAFIDYAAVKAATTIEMVLHHYKLFDKTNPPQRDAYRCSCPIHQGTDPSEFSVNFEKNLWRCFSLTACNAGGNHLDFVARMEDCTLHEAAWLMNGWFELCHSASSKTRPNSRKSDVSSKEKPLTAKQPIQAPTVVPAGLVTAPAPETGQNKPLSFTLQNLDPEHPYLLERGLSAETIAEFGLGFCPKGILAGRIAIPIHNASGELIANAGRWPGDPPEDKDKYRLPGGFKPSLELFNAHRAFAVKGDMPLVIVGGYFPVFDLWSKGFNRVVGLMGTSLSPKQEEMIREYMPHTGRIVVLMGRGVHRQEDRLKITSRLAEHCFVRSFPFPEEVRLTDLI